MAMFCSKICIVHNLVRCLNGVVLTKRPICMRSTVHKTFPGFARNQFRRMSAGGDDFSQRLIWVDLEMTGLNPEKDKIMEAAVVITDKDLNIVAQSNDLILNVNEEEINNMNDWCKKTHGQSGLSTECKLSGLLAEDADNILTKFVQEHTPPGKCPLAGNSVSNDRVFIRKYLPKLDNHIHFRVIDVTSIREVIRRWNPVCSANTPQKKLTHRALDDILESIDELRFYKNNAFKVASSNSSTS
nr:PREDICTED: probable oligoribonuclease isoform X2 [Bemisia tabaci]